MAAEQVNQVQANGAAVSAAPAPEPKEVITFDPPLNYPGVEPVSELDPGLLNELTGEELLEANAYMTLEGHYCPVLNTDIMFNMLLASYAFGLPYDMLEDLTLAQASPIKAAVRRYMGEDDPDVEVDDFVVRFKTPLDVDGRKITEIDLNMLKNLRTRDAVAVTDEMMREGVSTAMAELDTLYTFKLASRATGIPMAAFRQMPLRAALTVRNVAVNFSSGGA